LNENTSRLLLGLELGRRASEVFGDRLEELLLQRRQAGLDASLGEETAEQVALADMRRVQLRLAVDVACTASGLAIGWALRGWAALWTTCGLGAQICLEALDDGMTLGLQEQPMFWGGLFGVFGFAFQAWHWGRPPLPGPLWLLIAPARAVEMGLVSMA